MPNGLNYALAQVSANIPNEILELTFGGTNPLTGQRLDITSEILDRVVYPIVCPDVDIVAGIDTMVPLEESWWVPTQRTQEDVLAGRERYEIFRIPPEARSYSNISDVHGLLPTEVTASASFVGMSGASGCQGDILNAAGQMLESLSPTTQARPLVTKISGDMIRVQPAMSVFIPYVLSFRVAHDKNFTNMTGSELTVFGKLVVLAVKRYIYVNKKIVLDRAFIVNGVAAEAVTEIIDNYQEAFELYDETKRKLVGASLMTGNNMQEILQMML